MYPKGQRHSILISLIQFAERVKPHENKTIIHTTHKVMSDSSNTPAVEAVSPTTAAKMYDLFPNTKPAVGKYVGVISGLLRNLAPRDVLATASTFNQAGAVHDAETQQQQQQQQEASSPNSAANSPSRHSLDLLHSLCETAKKVFDEEPVIINVKVESKDRLVLVGDIHGQFRDLQQHVLSTQRNVSSKKGGDSVDDVDCKYLFLGDYVDRGPQGVEVITLLLALKVEYPNNVFMIRGNHEDAQVSRLYGFLTECKAKLEISSWGRFNEVFNNIPLGATVECEGGTIFACHGGLSPNVDNIAALQFLNRADYGNGLSEDSGEAIDGLLWSDPGDHNGFRRNMRGCGYTFGSDTTAKFCENNGVSFVVRAHQMVMKGYQWEHNDKLLTLFSAPNYCGINNNKGAIAVIMGSHANAAQIKKNEEEEKAAKEGSNGGADTTTTVDDEADNDELATKKHSETIPIYFYSFTSAPSEPCTLYYCTPNADAPGTCEGATPDINGSPITDSLPALPLMGFANSQVKLSDDVDDAIPAATPRPPADPTLNISGLKYFEEDNKKEEKRE